MKRLARGLLLGFFAWLPAIGAVAAPRLWVEAALEEAAVPVNAQAVYVLRLGHAVDVRAPEFEAPALRLAEVEPFGLRRESEQTRDGLRYRVLEQRYLVLPFASGELALIGAVAGRTPAALPGLAAGGRFRLAAPTMRLRVTPAEPGRPWLPARSLKVGASSAPPEGLKVGEVWSWQLQIEAVGVDGAVIAAPQWLGENDWDLQFDPPEFGRRIEGGRLLGSRRQTVYAQPRRGGRLPYPQAVIDWWRVPDGGWARQISAAGEVTVSPANSASAARSGPVAEAGPASAKQVGGAVAAVLFGVLATVGIVGIWRGGGRAAWDRRRERRRHWSALLAACAANDALAARRAWQAWARSVGDASSGPNLSARARQPERLAAALADLDAACFGPSGAAYWRGRPLREALRGMGYRASDNAVRKGLFFPGRS